MRFPKIRRLTISGRDSLIGLFFVSFFLAGFLFFFLPAVVESIRLGFSQNDMEMNVSWVGLKNYRYILFVSPDFVRSVVESLGSILVNVVVITLYSLVISNMLNKNLPGRGVFRALLFLPVIISTGIIDQLMGFSAIRNTGMAGSSGGSDAGADVVMQYILSLNVGTQLSGVIAGAIENIYSIITRSGVQIIIFLAGLQSISPSIYEAAYAEGCTAWESFWKITMPLLSPLVVVTVVYTVIDSFTSAQNVVMRNILKLITADLDYGTASAMSWIYFLLVGIFLTVTLLIINRFAFYETK